jgi:hypothetical protein
MEKITNKILEIVHSKEYYQEDKIGKIEKGAKLVLFGEQFKKI